MRGKDSKNNAARHGYLTLIALILHTVLIFVTMVPAFGEVLGEPGDFAVLSSAAFWVHVVLGTLAEVLGFVLVAFWRLRSPAKMACYKMKAWMAPVFVIWAVSLVFGAILHIFDIL